PAPCAAAQAHECKCPQGFSCSDEPCQFCRRIPEAIPWAVPQFGISPVPLAGTVNFQFECKPCENGSYSSSRHRWCRAWTDCESIGFVTLRPGNSTHNSMC
ncbi:TNR18 factor, partial [Thryothorus ludovicianus]|nr:TNR18 factor [Thryothorus ludovicianus]